jgi:plastocyanin
MHRHQLLFDAAIVVLLLLVAGCAPPGAAPPVVPSSPTTPPPAGTRATSLPAPTMFPSATAAPLSTSTPALAPTLPATATRSTPTSSAAEPAARGSAPPPVIIAMKNYAFVPKDITIAAGTTVIWRNDDSVPHTATADDKLFDSGDMSQGAQFSYTFTRPGVYPYYCTWHGAAGGQGMAGTVTVK